MTSVIAPDIYNASITDDDAWWYACCESESLGLICAIEYGRVGYTTFRISTSPDGITWTGRIVAGLVDSENLKGICWSESLGLFVIVMTNNALNSILTSPDGITWTRRNSPVIADWASVAWSAVLGMFSAVAGSTTGGIIPIMYSTDGITWVSSTVNTTSMYHNICASPLSGTFVAVNSVVAGSAYNSLSYSKDGINWSAFTAQQNDIIFRDCVFSGLDGSLVVISDVLEPASVDQTIPVPSQVYVFKENSFGFDDGASGSIREMNFRSVCYSKGLGIFMAVSGNKYVIDKSIQSVGALMYSVDGMSWNLLEYSIISQDEFRDIIWSELTNRFIVLATQTISSSFNVQLLKMPEITITIQESLTAIDFEVTIFSNINNKILNRSIRQAGTFSIPVIDTDLVNVIVNPLQGIKWNPNTEYYLNQFMVSTDPIGTPYYYKCTTAGQSAGAIPALPTVQGATVADNTIVWENIDSLAQPSIAGPFMPINQA